MQVYSYYFVTKLDNILFLFLKEHPWIKGQASDKRIDSAVLSRMKQFRAMNKLKKLALKVTLLLYVHFDINIAVRSDKNFEHIIIRGTIKISYARNSITNHYIDAF